MQLPVNHIDKQGGTHNLTVNMPYLAFIKHMAFAGHGKRSGPARFFRTLGMLTHYSQYLNAKVFATGRFSEPPTAFSDPTEKNHFSNHTGRAIADFLSKKIDHAIYTVNYEAAMRLAGHTLHRVQRPDLIAYTNGSSFALEAKGRSSGGPGDMAEHKAQAQAGPIRVNFQVACISYNLYTAAKCNYHDPFNDNIPFNAEAYQTLTRDYYRALSGYLQAKQFEYRRINVQGEEFYSVRLSRSMLRSYERDLSWPFRYHREFLFLPEASLLLPGNIHEWANTGLDTSVKPFLFDSGNDNDSNNNSETKTDNNRGIPAFENIYIDNDRVGLMLDY